LKGEQIMIDVRKYNPIPGGTYRVGQREAIEEMVRAYEKGVRVIDFEAPTSAGKTLVLRAFGQILINEFGLERVVFTSPQVVLIETGNLFGLPKLIGRPNYPCPGIESVAKRAAFADECVFIGAPRDVERYTACSKCLYLLDKVAFMDAEYGATTFARFRFDPNIRDRTDAVMIDESTNLFAALVEMSSVQLTPTMIENVANIEKAFRMEISRLTTEIDWISAELKSIWDDTRGRVPDKVEAEQISKLQKQRNARERRRKACAHAYEAIVSKIPYVVVEEPKPDKPRETAHYFKLLDVKKPFNEMVKKYRVVVLASGTPVTHLLAEKGKYHEVKAPHPIDPSRRMIYYRPVGPMSLQHKARTAHGIADWIASKYSECKAHMLVHCGNYDVARTLYDLLKNRVDNVICQTSAKRNDDLERWMRGKPGVFLSVCMEQGLDLAGPRYRWNIIAKINFPNLGSPWVSARNSIDNWMWYRTMTTINTIQACGRTTRSPDDYSETYILDASFRRFYLSNKNLFPQWFRDALHGI